MRAIVCCVAVLCAIMLNGCETDRAGIHSSEDVCCNPVSGASAAPEAANSPVEAPSKTAEPSKPAEVAPPIEPHNLPKAAEVARPAETIAPAPAIAAPTPPVRDEAAKLRAAQIDADKSAMNKELAAMGGTLDAWAEKLKPCKVAIEARVYQRRPNMSEVFCPDDGTNKRGHWFWNGEQKWLARELEGGAEGPDMFGSPLKALVELAHNLKERNIDLIFIPVPTKGQVYPEEFMDEVPEYWGMIPLRRHFVRRLLDEDVETIDLLPAFMEEKKQPSTEPLYPLTDQHWATRAIQFAAAKVAERLKRYRFPAKTAYTIREYTETILNSIPRNTGYDKHFPLETSLGRQVRDSKGKICVEDPQSPVLVVGDSFVKSVYFEYGCGFPAHLSKEMGFAIDFAWRDAGGPSIQKTLARDGQAMLKNRRVVILLINSYFLHVNWTTGLKLPPR